MQEAKKNGVSLYIKRTAYVPDAVVCLCFDYEVDSCCLNKLKYGLTCDCFASGSEETCVFYAMYLNVSKVLCGDPTAVKNSKVSQVACGANNGKVVMSWKTQPSGTAIRKSLGLALKALVPGKLFSTYQRLVRQAGGKPNREEFNWAASEAKKALSKICCGVVGKVNVKDGLAAAIVDGASKKLNPGDITGKSSKPTSHKPCAANDLPKIKVTGWKAFLVADYISTNAMGVSPIVCNKHVMLNVKNWDSLAGKLKKNIPMAVKRYEKLKGELGNVLAYMAMSSANVACDDTKSLVAKSPAVGDLSGVLKGAL